MWHSADRLEDISHALFVHALELLLLAKAATVILRTKIHIWLELAFRISVQRGQVKIIIIQFI